MRTREIRNVFYVYEHWRLDRNECFWVGKGHGNRAYDFERNNHYNNVVRKLHRLGYEVEVRFVATKLSEESALRIEIETISRWREAGVTLTNQTAGGEGVSGLKHSLESREKMSAANKRRLRKPLSDETKRKISQAQAGQKRGLRGPHSEETRRKMSAARRGKAANRPGYTHSDETREKIGNGNRGKERTAEQRDRWSVAHIGQKWITDGIKSRMITIDAALPDGWRFGRQ